MTKITQRRRSSAFAATFDTRSVLLFAVLTLGGGTALYAQPAPEGTAPSAAGKPATAFSSANALQAPRAASQTAFDRADDNRDGQLSAQEADRLPAIGNRFQELDTDNNGVLSFEEFYEGAKP